MYLGYINIFQRNVGGIKEILSFFNTVSFVIFVSYYGSWFTFWYIMIWLFIVISFPDSAILKTITANGV